MARAFPQPIGLGATFNPDLVQQLYAMAAHEARARGVHQALTPVVDVAREPRWGRVEETFGEDPYLVSRMGIAAVKGFQGDRSFRDKRHVVATLKHFAAHGQPESGNELRTRKCFGANLAGGIFVSFPSAVRDAGAMSVMASYNEIDGVPSHANRWLLTDVLRNEWGFQGTVVSDYYAIRELHERPELYGHHLAHDGNEAAALAVRAGVNIELPEPDCYKHLVELVSEERFRNRSSMSSLRRFSPRNFRWGCSTIPTSNPAEAERIVGCAEHRKTRARGRPANNHTPKKRWEHCPVRFEADQNAGRHWSERGPRDAGRLQRPAETHFDRSFRRSASDAAAASKCYTTKAARSRRAARGGRMKSFRATRKRIGTASPRRSKSPKRADVIVLAIGGNEQTSREAWMGNHLGDRASLDLVGQQNRISRRACRNSESRSSPLLFNGRPLAIYSPGQNGARHFRVLVSGTRVRAPRSRKPCLATSTRAASCRSQFRAPSATCPHTTTTNLPPAAAICSMMFRLSFRSATV